MQHDVAGLFPIPREQRGKIVHWVIGDAGEHIGEPSLGIDVVEFGGLNQRVHDGGALTATLGAGEEPGLASECDAAQRAFGGVVAKADASIVEEARKGRPALEHVIHGFGDFGMARELGALGSHPIFEVFRPAARYALDGRQAALCRRKPLISRSATKIASIFLTASNAIGEMTTGFLPRAFDAMSASTKNFLRPCAQHAASVMGLGRAAVLVESR